MKNNPLKILIYVIVASAIAGALWNVFISQKDTSTDNAELNTLDNTNTQVDNKLCFYNATKIKSGLTDKSYLVMQIEGDRVTGEFHNIPAEKDRKEGIFEGTVGLIDDATKTQLVTVWWDSQSEGMANTEELVVEFGANGAAAGFGEMLSQGDDVYTYKDKSKIVYGNTMETIGCTTLGEILSVEKYINNNINTIATDKPTKDNTWQVTNITTDIKNHTATVAYTDGRIKNNAQVAYTFDTGSGTVTISSFTPATPTMTSTSTLKKK